MKKKQTKIASASALPITLSVALVLASAILLARASVQSVHAAVSESSAAPKQTEGRRSAPVELSTSREHVGVREVAGFSARHRRMAQIDNGQVIYRQAYSETDGVHPSWVTTGSLGTARELHTATLLPSGMVLVAGGYYLTEQSSAELYDPARGSWSSTGSLGTRRRWHTATLLLSGKVLVTGGYNDSAYSLSSAELYDPATGRWSRTSSLGIDRYLHTATLLPSGKVLVVGGDGNRGPDSSAELYDPATGSWSNTGSLANARWYHTATLLPSGKVLVVGGFGTTAVLSSAELYDPATGSWSSTGSLGIARSEHTATLLPAGNVLVAGGYGNDPGDSAELYDPAAGSWTTTGSLGTARSVHTATLLASGNVLVAGGYNGSYLSSAELYDPATVSQITPAETTCSQFSSDAAETVSSVQYSLKQGLVQRVLPPSFEYWVPVTAAAGNNIFRITQTITSGNFNTFFAVNGNGSNVFDANCVSLQRTGSQSGDTVTVRFNAPAAGTYFIAINFDARSLIGEPVPNPTTIHYEFTTTGVPHSISGLDLVKH